MKHFKFTAEEVIGWLRIVRPGSIIGPQQQYMKDMQSRMWRDGQIFRERLVAIRNESPISGIGTFLDDKMVSRYKTGLAHSTKTSSRDSSKRDIDEEKEKSGESQGDYLRLRRQQMKDEMKLPSPKITRGVGTSTETLPPVRSSVGYIGNLISSWK